MTFENGRKLVIEAPANSRENIYVSSLTLDGRDVRVNYLKHEQMLKGGVLRFAMTSSPDTARGATAEARPYSFTVSDTDLNK